MPLFDFVEGHDVREYPFLYFINFPIDFVEETLLLFFLFLVGDFNHFSLRFRLIDFW